MNREKWLRLAACILLSSACLYLAARGIDVAHSVATLKRTSAAPVVFALLCLFISFFIRAWRWRYLLLPVAAVPLGPLFRCTLIGFMGNYLLPFRAGEVVRAISIGRMQNINQISALGSIAVERLLDAIVLCLTPLMAISMMPARLLKMSVVALLLCIGVLLLVLFVAGKSGAPVTPDLLVPAARARLIRRLLPVLAHFVHGFKGLCQVGAVVPVVSLSIACWAFHGLFYFFLFEALNIELPVSAALILRGVIGLGVTLPGAPGYIGTFEYFAILGLGFFDIDREIAFGYALLAHSVQLASVTVVGMLCVFNSGLSSLLAFAKRSYQPLIP